MMYLESYKGNEKTVSALIDWLNGFFHEFCYAGTEEKIKPYVILHGTSGNGKTCLIEWFAKDYKVDLLRFTMDDFSDVAGIKMIEKSLNLQSIETVNLSKIVLIDNIEDLKDKKYAHLLKRLYTLYETCNYPLVYIVDDLHGLDSEFIGNGLVLKVEKPITSEIVKLLNEKAKELNIKCDCIEEIARESHSVRTALQGLLIGRPIIKNSPLNSISSNLKLILQGSLKKDLNYPTLVALFRGIKEYDLKSYQLRERLCQLDEIWHIEFFKDKERTLDPIFINNMENIDIIKLEYKEREKKAKEPKKKKEENPPDPPVVEQKPEQNISVFLDNTDNEWS